MKRNNSVAYNDIIMLNCHQTGHDKFDIEPDIEI